MPRRRWLAAGVIGLAVTTSACMAGPSDRPAIVTNQDGGGPATPTRGTEPVPLPPLENGRNTLTWRSCDGSISARLADPPLPANLKVECGQLTAILDPPALPGRSTTKLALLKVGTGPVPLAVVNDIDGLPGTVFAARLAAQLPPELLNKFTLIGVDRRGTGLSDPLRCVPEEVRSTIITADPATLDMSKIIEAVGRAGQQCQIAMEYRLAAIDTWRSAGDLDKLRQDLGVPRLNAIGRGEGSRVLTTFAERYPAKVGRLVLDGIPDPATDPTIGLEGTAAGLEAAYAAFVTECQARCGLAADAVPKLLDSVRARPLFAGADTVTAGTVLNAMRATLGDRDRWPALAAALTAARSGDGSKLQALVAPLIDDASSRPSVLDVALATGCNDTGARLPPERIVGSAKAWQGRFPLFGPLVAQDMARCAPWPVAASPVHPITVKDLPPILGLSTAADPVTPRVGTERALQGLPAGIHVSWESAGHGALGRSACVTAAAVAFLMDGKVPASSVICPP